MDITQVNRHQQHQPTKEFYHSETKQTEQPSFEGELVFASKDIDLFSSFKTDPKENKELEEHKKNDPKKNEVKNPFEKDLQQPGHHPGR